MTWTYSGDPASSNKDQVRFLSGDTNTNNQLISDEEINYLLTQWSNPQQAAQDACLAIMAKLARDVDYTIGPEQVAASNRYKAYKELYETLRRRWIARNAGPSWDDGSARPQVERPVFDVGMHDNPGSGVYDLDGDRDRSG